RLPRLGRDGDRDDAGVRGRTARGVRGEQETLLDVDRVEAGTGAGEITGRRVTLRARPLAIEVRGARLRVTHEHVARLEHRRTAERVVHLLAQEVREH